MWLASGVGGIPRGGEGKDEGKVEEVAISVHEEEENSR